MNLDDILNSLEVAMEKWFKAKQEHDAAYAEYRGKVSIMFLEKNTLEMKLKNL